MADARRQNAAPQPAAFDQLPGQEAVERRQVHAAVRHGQHRVRAARAKADDRTELRIAPHADGHRTGFGLDRGNLHRHVA
ncbi:hypothetical protein G6F22_019116 [Rhizopus arrhizus]|nr:hypothetical protein G6F22_019116 [Rhizopus arrhizus]